MAGALSAGIWMYMEWTGKFGFLDFFEKFHLGWLVGVLVIIVVGRFYEMRLYWKKEVIESKVYKKERAE